MGSSWYGVPPIEGDEPTEEDRIKIDFDVNRLLVKLSSRKFVVAVLGVISMLVAGRKTEAAGIVIAYLAAEGYIDGKAV